MSLFYSDHDVTSVYPSEISVHHRTKNFLCSYSGCDKVYSSTSNLKRHLKTHNDPLPYKCNVPDCNAEFKKKQRLLVHLGAEHNDKQFKCSYEDCQAVFALPSALKRHENSHYREYKCNKEGCVYVTNKWSLLRKHIADVHQTKHVCSICGLTVSTSKQLNIHSQIHQKERQVFACTWKDCDRSYTTVSNLQQHLKSFHLKVKPYNCTRPNCSATFAHKSSLMRHLHLAHVENAIKKKQKAKKPKRILSEILSGYVEGGSSCGTKEPLIQTENDILGIYATSHRALTIN